MEHVPDKEFLRKKLQTFRKTLTQFDVESYSQLITEKCLLLLDWRKIKSVYIYIPIAKHNEVNTWPIIKWLQRNNPDAVIAVPEMKDGQIRAAILKEDTVLKKGSFKTLVPQNAKLLPEDFKFDIIIVPTLGFDKFNYRLGYGKGYYDKFLDGQPGTKIGLSYSEAQIFPQLEHEDHDVALDYIVTEKAVNERPQS